jgi:hypothetical protein
MYRTDPVAADARLNKFLDADIRTPSRMAGYAEDAANALVSTMKTVTTMRPDLANKHFDFQSDKGAIKVISSDMSATDIAWLQKQLNSNTALLKAVQAYHDEAVSGYVKGMEAQAMPVTYADVATSKAEAAAGTAPQITDAQIAQISDSADRMLGGFLALFRSMGAAQDIGWKTHEGAAGGTRQLLDGSKMDIGHDPTTAAGFLTFIKSAQALKSGAYATLDKTGKTTIANHGQGPGIFLPGAIPRFQSAARADHPPPSTLGYTFAQRAQLWDAMVNTPTIMAPPSS